MMDTGIHVNGFHGQKVIQKWWSEDSKLLDTCFHGNGCQRPNLVGGRFGNVWSGVSSERKSVSIIFGRGRPWDWSHASNNVGCGRPLNVDASVRINGRWSVFRRTPACSIYGIWWALRLYVCDHLDGRLSHCACYCRGGNKEFTFYWSSIYGWWKVIKKGTWSIVHVIYCVLDGELWARSGMGGGKRNLPFTKTQFNLCLNVEGTCAEVKRR